MAPAYFLKIDGIAGESGDPEHSGELELQSFVWSDTVEPRRARAPTTVSFTLPASVASPQLFAACASGRRIAHAVLTMREGERGGAEDVRRWRFSDVVVASYVTAGSGEEVFDQVSLLADEVAVLALPERRSLRLRLVRPDDLLNLEIQAVNLRVDRQGQEPALVVADPEQAARLIVLFPPQTIAESAFFEYSIVDPDLTTETPIDPPPENPDAGKSEDDNGPLPTPGSNAQAPPPTDSVARIADSSRLVFDVPAAARVPLSIEGVLDWSGLELAVNPIAEIPPEPTDEQIAAAPAIRPPDESETALELPYRLVVSPVLESSEGRASWTHRTQPFTSRGRTELWHTRLALRGVDQEGNAATLELTRTRRAPLRAIWSPDYAPFDRPPPEKPDPNLGLTAMSPNDRHQIVILTSAFHGYEYEVELDLLAPFDPFEATTRAVTTRPRIPFRLKFPYVPTPFEAELLMLSPLGGWLRSRGHWTPPYQLLPRFPFRPDLGKILATTGLQMRALPAGDTEADVLASPNLDTMVLELPELTGEHLDLSEWVHVAAQGRDHYVRIVYEGQLKPFKNKAALIKVTERKFKESETGNTTGAYLMQRMFIVVREPEKTFGEDDRAMPYKHVRLTTLVTPDIAEPDYVVSDSRSFWVEVKTGPKPDPLDRARFAFHGVGTDVDGKETDFTVPMMFVSLSAQGDVLDAVHDKYNEADNAGDLENRELRIPGQQLAFAKPDADPAKRNSVLVTESLNFVLDENGDPKLLMAAVRIPQVEELLGTSAATTIRLYDEYVKNDLDGATGVFAQIAKPKLPMATPTALDGMNADRLGVEFSSDQAGGFATPNLGVSTLTRSLGPLAGETKDAVTDTFTPASFFAGGLAKLFGSFDLADLLPASTLGKNAPKLRTTSSDIPGGNLVVTTLEWKPDVDDKDLTVVEFVKDHNGTTVLDVKGRIEKPVLLTGTADPPKFEFTGTLNAFRVGVLKSVFVNFVLFEFTKKSGQKPDVTVQLDTAQPIEFAGDLEFVEELRKAIPPDLFGDGPSLDITSTGVRAGFAITLPPIAVGVFALKDVSLGAGLTLPFTDGKPALDFNVSTRERPFLLSVSIFGGGGFFHLQLDTAGMKELEAAFEFGVTASLDLGVASGSVHMMAGIYFSLVRQDPSNDYKATLSGYLRVGGSMSVLGLITVSVEFNLSFTYDSATDKAYGRATLTVEVEVAFFSASVELTVERGFGGQDGDPKFIEAFTSAPVWKEYATAFAGA
jgi:type VI protein secretion system component Hcp